MAEQIVAPRTHPFRTTLGWLVRVVDDGRQTPYLESSSGTYLQPCGETGPEILKLAQYGRAIWNALNDLVEGQPVQPWMEIVHDQTAATFDHNEPEEQPAEQATKPPRAEVLDLMAAVKASLTQKGGA